VTDVTEQSDQHIRHNWIIKVNGISYDVILVIEEMKKLLETLPKIYYSDEVVEHIYCHVLSDYRRVLDWQLRLLDHSVHFTIYYSTLHCLPSRPSLFSAGPRTSCRPSYQLSTLYSVLNYSLITKTGCQSQSYFTTDDQSVSKSWFQGPCGSHDRIFISVDIYEYCFIDCVRPLWREVGSVICHSHCPSIVSKYIQIYM
jgi:hypothetical protein